MSHAESPSSSVQSSPNVASRLLPLHLLPTANRGMIPTIVESDSDSDDESILIPASSYYVSPRRPDKRRHLSVPSPRMARLFIQGSQHRFRPSIPGYGEGTKKTIRVSASTSEQSNSTSTVGTWESKTRWASVGHVPKLGMQCPKPVPEVSLASQVPVEQLEMPGAIPVSEVPLASVGPVELQGMRGAIPVSEAAFSARFSPRPVRGRVIQRLFNGEGSVGEVRDATQSSSPSSTPRFLVRRRIVLPRIQDMRIQYRNPRSPIVISEASSESEEESAVPPSVAISRVVSEILGRDGVDNSFLNTAQYVDAVGLNDDIDSSPVGFQEKEKLKDPSKKEKDKIVRKDAISASKLAESKIKEISKYPCCDNRCLIKLGFHQVMKHRKYYFRLRATEKNVLLRGCLQSGHRGRSAYRVLGKAFCREGFKKLYSVGNTRLQRVSHNIFTRVENEVFCKEKSTAHLALVQWLKGFFERNVESLPNKDIFHLPDNWTKLEVFEEFKNESEIREDASVKYSWFCRIWTKEFPRVRIPKRSRFSTCAPCTEFKALRDKATLEAERGNVLENE